MFRPSSFRKFQKFSLLVCAGLGCVLLGPGCGPVTSPFAGCVDTGECIASIEVRKYSGTIPLSPDSRFWSSAQGPQKITVELGPQLITNPQWPNPSIKAVSVSVARTTTEIAIRLEWEDSEADQGAGHTRAYTDQAAVMFPLDRSQAIPPITMGWENQVVNIWQWKAVRQAQTISASSSPGSQKTPVDDLNAEGFSTLTLQEHQSVMGKGVRSATGWQVVFKRSLINSDEHDSQFKGSTPMGMAVWNGSNRETNGQKGIAGWILLKFI